MKAYKRNFFKTTWMLIAAFLIATMPCIATPIDELAAHEDLILIYSSTCPHCQRFAPVFADVANHDHFKYYAFTVDGNTLPSVASHSVPATPAIFSDFYPALSAGSAVVPDVFLMNNTTLAYIPVSVGEEPEEELVMQLNKIANTLFPNRGEEAL